MYVIQANINILQDCGYHNHTYLMYKSFQVLNNEKETVTIALIGILPNNEVCKVIYNKIKKQILRPHFFSDTGLPHLGCLWVLKIRDQRKLLTIRNWRRLIRSLLK